MEVVREVWRSFFNLFVEVKEVYLNFLSIYEGYGSRLGVEKGVIFDWNDYYFFYYLFFVLKDFNKWFFIFFNIRYYIKFFIFFVGCLYN